MCLTDKGVAVLIFPLGAMFDSNCKSAENTLNLFETFSNSQLDLLVWIREVPSKISRLIKLLQPLQGGGAFWGSVRVVVFRCLVVEVRWRCGIKRGKGMVGADFCQHSRTNY